MNIISFDSGRVTWLFPLEEFAPAAGTSVAPTVIEQIALRYDFTIRPEITTREDLAKKGLPFGMGKFETDGKRVAITDFIIYNDGIVAVAEKTEWSDAFLNDVIPWVKESFGFREVSSGIRKLYSSGLVIDFEHPIRRLISGYEQIIEIIHARTVMLPIPKPMQFARLDFEVDKRALEAGQVVQPKFVLERRPGVDFSQERYFSGAPMHTEHHIEVLTEIEKLAAKTSASPPPS